MTRPVTSATVSVQPLTMAELRAGESYDSWVCEVCDSVIPFAPRAPRADPRDLPNAMVQLQCPRCNSRRRYAIHDRRVRQYPWDLTALAHELP